MSKKKKLLYVSPHLSTGGMPQYLLKQIEEFKDKFEIEVVEYNDHSGNAYVVQKNQIKNLCKVHTLYDNKEDLLNIIQNYGPNIIHFTEIPEHFIEFRYLDSIFSDTKRKYFIVVSTHGSDTNPDEIQYHPDRYVLVSEWSRRKFEHLGIDTAVWEYPIQTQPYDKTEFKKELGFEEDWKHVLMVGLFTPGKNQGEIFGIARQLEKYKIKFHFVGNQAINFEDYWKPLMDFKPSNCVVWGERNDTDKFYKAADLFYFSSTLELNPLSIKEALGYGLPSIFRKLDTYLDTYDNNELVTYIDNDTGRTKTILLKLLKPEFNEIPGWFSYPTLYDKMVESSPFTSTFVEVGSWFGKSTNYLAQKIKESKKKINLTVIDTFKGTDDEQIHTSIVNNFNGDIFHEFIDNSILSNTYQQFDIIKDTSENASNHFLNNSIDYIMIDAGHSYEAVSIDLNKWYHKVKPGGIISGDDFYVFTGVTNAVNEYFYDQVEKFDKTFVRRKPRIQIKHLLTNPTDLRERVSTSSLKQLEKYGMMYTPIINKRYEGLPPKENCRRPEHISPDNKPGEIYPGAGLGYLTGPIYGCFLAHRTALETIDDVNFDYTIILEADAFIHTNLEDFVNIVHKACFISERDNVPFISFANNYSSEMEKLDDNFTKTGFTQNEAHAYMIPNRDKQWYIDRIKDCKWDGADIWYNVMFTNHNRLRYTTNNIYVKQTEGISLLDEKYKSWK